MKERIISGKWNVQKCTFNLLILFEYKEALFKMCLFKRLDETWDSKLSFSWKNTKFNFWLEKSTQNWPLVFCFIVRFCQRWAEKVKMTFGLTTIGRLDWKRIIAQWLGIYLSEMCGNFEEYFRLVMMMMSRFQSNRLAIVVNALQLQC